MTMFDDTAPEARAVQFQVLRRIGMAGRMAMTFELSDNMRAMVEAGVCDRYPQWGQQAVEHEVLRLMIGDELSGEVFGKDQDCP